MSIDNEATGTILLSPIQKKPFFLMCFFLAAVGNTLSPLITSHLIGSGFAFLTMVMVEIFIGILAYAIFYRKQGQISGSHLKKALPFFLLVLLMQTLPVIFTYSYHPQLHFSLSDIPGIIYFIIISPFCEEVFYRGCLFDSLCHFCNILGAGQAMIVPLLATSLIFSVMHTQFSSITEYSSVFTLSILLIFVRVLTKGLALPIMLHSFFNVLFILTIYKTI
ncbi:MULTISPECIES: CPBP family intramembrane glutamic endopeptidase [Pseudescherichia]|uniref:CPBP family intramembrane glutamic endopeptidase n=1 Tax=Pseudescherichia TaxID=2055880 RepID=UPI001EDE16EC|nr:MULTISPECIES: CPBP family intramembrane glutamic endopeptidase [Pseudescherichia]